MSIFLHELTKEIMNENESWSKWFGNMAQNTQLTHSKSHFSLLVIWIADLKISPNFEIKNIKNVIHISTFGQYSFIVKQKRPALLYDM